MFPIHQKEGGAGGKLFPPAQVTRAVVPVVLVSVTPPPLPVTPPPAPTHTMFPLQPPLARCSGDGSCSHVPEVLAVSAEDSTHRTTALTTPSQGHPPTHTPSAPPLLQILRFTSILCQLVNNIVECYLGCRFWVSRAWPHLTSLQCFLQQGHDPQEQTGRPHAPLSPCAAVLLGVCCPHQDVGGVLVMWDHRACNPQAAVGVYHKRSRDGSICFCYDVFRGAALLNDRLPFWRHSIPSTGPHP
jgi:hypothetical protein